MIKDWTKIQEEYKGLWVALLDDEQTVVGRDKTLRGAMEQAIEKGCKDPIMTRMPSEIILYAGSF